MSDVDNDAVDGGYVLELIPPRNRVGRRAMWWWGCQALLVTIVMLGCEAAVLAVLWSTLPPAVSAVVIAVSVLWALIYLFGMPFWRFRVHRWETTPEAVYTSSGWIWQKWRVAPLSRIQTVDTERGPLQQLFNLATVRVTTASSAGAIKIEGLDHEVAKGLVAHLTETTQATPGDAT